MTRGRVAFAKSSHNRPSVKYVPASGKLAPYTDGLSIQGARVTLFFTIAAVHLLALISPGPDFVFVSQAAVSRSRAQAMCGVIGITLGIAIWAALALLGLHVVLARMAWLQRLVMLAGGLYLVGLGLRLLLSGWRGATTPAAGIVVERGLLRSLRTGLLTNLANPKAMVYFGSVFSAFVGEGATDATRWELWLLVVVESLAWFSVVAALFALPAIRQGYLRVARWIDGGAGAVFILFGAYLAFGRRS